MTDLDPRFQRDSSTAILVWFNLVAGVPDRNTGQPRLGGSESAGTNHRLRIALQRSCPLLPLFPGLRLSLLRLGAPSTRIPRCSWSLPVFDRGQLFQIDGDQGVVDAARLSGFIAAMTRSAVSLSGHRNANQNDEAADPAHPSLTIPGPAVARWRARRCAACRLQSVLRSPRVSGRS